VQPAHDVTEMALRPVAVDSMAPRLGTEDSIVVNHFPLKREPGLTVMQYDVAFVVVRDVPPELGDWEGGPVRLRCLLLLQGFWPCCIWLLSGRCRNYNSWWCPAIRRPALRKLPDQACSTPRQHSNTAGINEMVQL
jgi:hypothetical protein